MTRTATDIRPLYAIISPDRFLRTEAAERLLQDIAGDGLSIGPARFDGATAEPAEVLDELRTPSLLGDRRVVILDDADVFLSIKKDEQNQAAGRATTGELSKAAAGAKAAATREKSAESVGSTNRELLERYCSNPSDESCLILLCRSLPKNTRVFRAIDKRGKVISVAPPRGRREAITWIMRRAADIYDKRISQPVAETLYEHLGDSVGGLDAELSKLAAYVGNRPEMQRTDIDALTGQHREEKVFAVVDAIAEGNVETALRHWEQVLATNRAAPALSIGGLAWGIRRLLHARRELDEGVPVEKVRSNHRLYGDAAVVNRRLKSFSAAALENQLEDLMRADLSLKTGGTTIEIAIEKFIVKHSQRNA